MRRKSALVLLACAAAVVGVPNMAAAQLSVGVHLYWEWNDGAWRPHRADWDARRGAYRLDRRVGWIAAAYMPPPGYCREWIPGLPGWRQPLPVPCDQLYLSYGYARPGVLILGSAGFGGPVVRSDRDRWWGEAWQRGVWRGRVERDDRYRRAEPAPRVAHRSEVRGNRGRGHDEGRGRRGGDRDERGRDRGGRGRGGG